MREKYLSGYRLATGNRFRLLEVDFERMGGVGNFLLRLLRAGIDVVEGQEAENGDEQTASGGDKRFSDTTGDLASGGADVTLHAAEGFHHAGNGAQKTEERSRRDDGIEGGHALRETGQLLARSADESVSERVFFVIETVDQDAGDRVIALLAEGESRGDVTFFNALEHLFNDLGFATAIFTDNEEHALHHDRDAQERNQQDRPHDGTAMLEELHRSHVAKKKREGETLGDHRIKKFMSFLLGVCSRRNRHSLHPP